MKILLILLLSLGCALGAIPTYVITEGDSMTAGYGLAVGEDWPTLMVLPGTTVVNVSRSGSKTEDIIPGNRVSGPMVTNGTSNQVAVLWIGYNDVKVPESLATMTNNITTWRNTIIAARPGAKTIISTVVDGGSFGSAGVTTAKRIRLGELNTWIRANSQGFDAVVDIAASPQAADWTDLTWREPAGTHFTLAATNVFADMFETAIKALFNPLVLGVSTATSITVADFAVAPVAPPEVGAGIYYGFTADSFSHRVAITSGESVLLDPGADGYTFQGLEWNTLYQFTNTGIDGDLNESAPRVVSIWSAPELPPSGLLATVTGPTTITLAFTEPDEVPATGYQLQMSPDGVSWGSGITAISAGTYSIDIGALVPSTSYYFRARSLNTNPAPHQDGVSGWSSSVSATTDADLVAPVLSLASAVRSGATSGSITATTDKLGGRIFCYISTSASDPSAASVESGLGAISSASQLVTTIDEYTFNAAGLTTDVTYYAYLVQKSAGGIYSDVVYAGSFVPSINFLVNEGFEAGAAGWTSVATGGTADLGYGVTPITGAKSARLIRSTLEASAYTAMPSTYGVIAMKGSLKVVAFPSSGSMSNRVISSFSYLGTRIAVVTITSTDSGNTFALGSKTKTTLGVPSSAKFAKGSVIYWWMEHFNGTTTVWWNSTNVKPVGDATKTSVSSSTPISYLNRVEIVCDVTAAEYLMDDIKTYVP